MPKVDVSLTDYLDVQIDRLVEDGTFRTRQEAIEELLTLGINSHTLPRVENDEPESPDRYPLDGSDDEGYAF